MPVTPHTGDQPWFVEEVLRGNEWLRDPTAKVRQVAQEVIEEFDAGAAQGTE